MNLRDVVVTIPTKRLPPVTTLKSYVLPEGVEAFVIADPSVFKAHRRWLKNENTRRKKKGIDPLRARVIRGKEGLVPQVMMCYTTAKQHGYDFFFRLDDDILPKTFIKKDRSHPTLSQVMRWARKCADECEVSLVGFGNTSRVDWLGEGYGRSYALVTGGMQLCRSSAYPKKFIDSRQTRYEDVYRSLAHREKDGAIGRVKFVGLNKQSAHETTTIKITEQSRMKSIKRILKRFPDFVKYHGEKTARDGSTYPVFRYRRHPGYRA